MCGIAGYYSENSRLDLREFEIFVNSLSPRGPDGFGVKLLDNSRLLFGHRRLSILDISESGSQPMVSLDGRLCISFNGEIYNFLELRKELESDGFVFRSESDTEVVLAAYARWGEDCQKRFNGMWAFAIWDQREKLLFLSRDRFGVKPLFFLNEKERFAFASELKAFLNLPARIRPEIDPGVFAWGETFESARKTFLVRVKNLNAGHQMVFRPGSPPEIKQWWRTSDNLVKVPNSYEEQVREFKRIFLDACRVRMRSDVPIGTALSGGIDSSAVICGMANVQKGINGEFSRQAKSWRKAFVFDYANTPHSERKYAEEVIKYVDAEPNYIEISSDKINQDDLVSAIFSFEGVQQPALGPWLTYREMRRRGIFVSIDGHGGDELIGGYFHYCQPAMLDDVFGIRNTGRWDDLQNVHLGLHQAEDTPDGFLKTQPPSRFSVKKNYYLNKLKGGLCKIIPKGSISRNLIKKAKSLIDPNSVQDFWEIKPSDLEFTNREEVPGFDRLNQALYDDFHFGMLPNILRNFDRLSMAHGIEIRAPLLDWRLVTFAFSLPSSCKIGAGFTKRILRDSLKGLMPEKIRIRKSKIGFSSPMRTWLAGPLKDFVFDIIHSISFISNPIWSGKNLFNQIENSYRKSDYAKIEKLWPYIQTQVLIDEMKKVSN